MDPWDPDPDVMIKERQARLLSAAGAVATIACLIPVEALAVAIWVVRHQAQNRALLDPFGRLFTRLLQADIVTGVVILVVALAATFRRRPASR